MMAFLYPWATKEYLLWNMTIGQIIMYHNRGVDLKWPDPNKTSSGPGLLNKSASELRKMRDDILSQMDQEKSDKTKEAMKAKYGDV